MSGRLTLLDFAKSKDPNGQQAQVIELLQQYNPMLEDAPAEPANAPYGNRTTYRRTLPAVGTAKINKGVVRSKSLTDQRVDTIGYFAGRSEVDVRIAKLEGMAAFTAKRSEENNAFNEAMAQLVATTAVYGSVLLDEASFDGFIPRLGTINEGTSAITSQVWRNGAVGADNASILVVDWGKYANSLIFPPNTVAGLDVQDKGEVSVNDDDGNPFQAMLMLFDWFVGLKVADPRHIGRLCNIDVSDALLEAPTLQLLHKGLMLLDGMMPDPGPNQRVLYCPKHIYIALLTQAINKTNVYLTMREYLGKMVPSFNGYPIRKMDVMLIAETLVT
jgi:hypothetical protein